MKILFLDDDQKRHETFTDILNAHDIVASDCRARTIQVAIEHLDASVRMGEPFDWVSLDHDLDGQVFVTQPERTGQVVAQHIAQMPEELRPRRVVVHSWSEDGAMAMLRILHSARVRSQWEMFDTPKYLLAVMRLREQLTEKPL